MNPDKNHMKSYIIAAYIFGILAVVAMCVFQSEAVLLELGYHSIGQYMLIVSFNVGSFVLFILSGGLRNKDKGQSDIILFFAVIIRLYTYWHIHKLFTGSAEFNMYAVNTLLVGLELTLYFLHNPGNEMEELEMKNSRLRVQADELNSKMNELKSKHEQTLAELNEKHERKLNETSIHIEDLMNTIEGLRTEQPKPERKKPERSRAISGKAPSTEQVKRFILNQGGDIYNPKTWPTNKEMMSYFGISAGSVSKAVKPLKNTLQEQPKRVLAASVV